MDCDFHNNCILSYQVVAGAFSHSCSCNIFCNEVERVLYSKNCFSCKDCFGCIGLRNKQYCILNTQYTKEDYEEIVAQIIESMKQS